MLIIWNSSYLLLESKFCIFCPDNFDLMSLLFFRIFAAGAQPRFGNLYHPVSFPVGKGTPMINSMVEWDHSIEWSVANFSGKGSRSGELVVDIDLSKETDEYLAGHTIDGRVLFPATGYLVSIIYFKSCNAFGIPILKKDLYFYFCLLDVSLENVR